MVNGQDNEAIKERIRAQFRENLRTSRRLQQAVRENGEEAMDVFFDLTDDNWIQKLPQPGSAPLLEERSLTQV